jgi:hypothetical protein
MGSIIHPSVYTGQKGQNVYNWLKRFEALCSGNGWTTDEQKIRHLNAYLNGTALSWFNSAAFNPNTAQWNDVKTAFLKYFDHASNMLSLELELQKRQMSLSENPISYYQDIKDLCERIDSSMSEEKKLKELYKGLPPAHAQLVCMLQPKTVAEFWEKLMIVEQSLGIANMRSDEKVISQIYKEDTPKNVVKTTENSKPVEELVRALLGEFSLIRDDLRKIQGNAYRSGTYQNRGDQRYQNQNRGQRQWQPQSQNRQRFFNERTIDGRPICQAL